MKRWCRSAQLARLPGRGRGMALIAVLWIVAALSVMVLGVSGTVRQQIGIVGMQRDQVSGQAIGDAALALALQQLLLQTQREPGLSSLTVTYAGTEVEVELAPLNGLISLNGAGAPLLASLLGTAGGLAPGPADALAAKLVAWRDQRPDVDPTAPGAGDVRARRFESPEDLLLVPGVDYALYARIAPLVSADLPNTSQVNPLAAPPGVLAVLAGGNTSRVAAYLGQRQGGSSTADASGFRPEFVSSGRGGTDVYRILARVPLGEGKILVLARDVALGAAHSPTAPWRILRTDRHILAPGA